MEKLVVTRHRGGPFESRLLRACPLQPRHALQGKKSNRNCVGVSLERRGERPAAPAQRCNRYHQRIPDRIGGQQGSGSLTLAAQREQAVLEPEGNDLRGTRQPLPRQRTASFVQIGSPV